MPVATKKSFLLASVSWLPYLLERILSGSPEFHRNSICIANSPEKNGLACVNKMKLGG